MKVLHITNNYPTLNLPIFGIFVKEQIESLNKLNINNDILFINGRENGRLEYFKSILRIRKKLKNKEYDLIHCHHALSSLCLILSGKSKRNKVLVSFQNDPIDELGNMIFKFIKSFTHGWLFKNNSNLIIDKYSFYLPNGVNVGLFKLMDKALARKELKLGFNKIYILFVSSNFVRKQKRYDRFNETLTMLREEYNYKNIEEIKLINNIRKEIPIYFNAVDLHLLTSDFEGSPNSVKESMACNTPIVSTNVGNVLGLLNNVNNSYVAKEKTPKELARLVDCVLKNKDEMENNSREELMKLKLDIDSVALKLIDIYKTIINK